MMLYFRNPLFSEVNIIIYGDILNQPLDVFEAVRDHGTEADEENVCVGVGEWPEPVIVLLTGRVKQAQGVGLVPVRTHFDKHAVNVLTNPMLKLTA